MLAREGKLGALFLDDEVGQTALSGKLVAEAQTIVVEAEADIHQVAGALLLHAYEQLVVVVAYGGFLAPNGSPGVVEGGVLHLLDGEPAVEGEHLRGVAGDVATVPELLLLGVATELEAHGAGEDYCLVAKLETVGGGAALGGDTELHGECLAW